MENIILFTQDHAIAVGVILVVSFILSKSLKRVLEGVVRRTIRGDKYSSKEAEEKRENTLINVFEATLRIVIFGAAFMMILSELGVNIGPLIAAAGVVGLALGFGGQYLIKDIIAGFFIILENQYRVGDIVSINGKNGEVQSVNLRVTALRDVDGTVHYIPNGEIKIASNMSKDFAKVNFDVGVAYNANLDKVIEVVNQVGSTLSQDSNWKDEVNEPPQFLRVAELGDSAVMVKIVGQVRPGSQWKVTGEMLKRIKQAFDQSGIEIPFPQQTVHIKKD